MDRESRPGGRPTKKQAAERTTALLDKARELFGQKGFAGTTIDEIAGCLRFSKHTIYNRYANKLELLEAVVDRDVERFRAALIDARDQHSDPMDALRSMACIYFGFSASPGYSSLYAAIALESASSEHLRKRLGQWAEMSLDPLKKAIEAAEPPGGWNSPSTEQVCNVLIDLLDGEATRAKWSTAAASPETCDKLFTARWILFRRALGAEKHTSQI